MCTPPLCYKRGMWGLIDVLRRTKYVLGTGWSECNAEESRRSYGPSPGAAGHCQDLVSVRCQVSESVISSTDLGLI
jgi:hypothetical protein